VARTLTATIRAAVCRESGGPDVVAVDDVGAALQYVADGRAVGKVVLDFSAGPGLGTAPLF
jgi:hypothetical protein